MINRVPTSEDLRQFSVSVYCWAEWKWNKIVAFKEMRGGGDRFKLTTILITFQSGHFSHVFWLFWPLDHLLSSGGAADGKDRSVGKDVLVQDGTAVTKCSVTGNWLSTELTSYCNKNIGPQISILELHHFILDHFMSSTHWIHLKILTNQDIDAAKWYLWPHSLDCGYWYVCILHWYGAWVSRQRLRY